MKGIFTTILFLAVALLVEAQTLWRDDDRSRIPTFDREGIAPNTVVNVYKSTTVMDNILNSRTTEEELYANVQFDERARPLEIIIKTPESDYPFHKTIYSYKTDDTFTVTLFRGDEKLFHKWHVVDSVLVAEESYVGEKLRFRWKYRAEDDFTVDEKFKGSGKLIRVAIMKKDSMDADARYCVYERKKLMKMSLYRLNETGNPERVELLDADDLNRAANKLHVDRKDLAEFDAERIRMALTGLTYYWNFEYSENDELTKQILFDPHSQEVGMVRYFRDENGTIERVIADAEIASEIPWYRFYDDLAGLFDTKAIYYYQGLELLNVDNRTLHDLKGRPAESIFEYVGYKVGGRRVTYRYEYFPE